MGWVATDNRRSLYIEVTKSDSGGVVAPTTITLDYQTHAGITDAQLQQMSDVDFASHIALFKAWVLSAYEPGNTGLYASINWDDAIDLALSVIQLNIVTDPGYTTEYPGIYITSNTALSQSLSITGLIQRYSYFNGENLVLPVNKSVSTIGNEIIIPSGSSVSNIIDTSLLLDWYPLALNDVLNQLSVSSHTTNPVGDQYTYQFNPLY